MKIFRNIFNELEDQIDQKKITILVGARQVGKTTLLKDLMEKATKKGLHVLSYNLENPMSSELFALPIQEVLSHLIKLRPKVDALFLDEFHLYKNATKLFKILYDDYDIKVFASGSSALEMHSHLKESLAGRKQIFKINPLSFREFLSSFQLDSPLSFHEPLDEHSHLKIREKLKEFLVWGGMPGLLHTPHEEEKRSLLEEYVESYINKDIKGFLREEDILSFTKVLKVLAKESSFLVSEQGLSKKYGYSLRQIRKDLTILDQTYIIKYLRPWFNNPRTEMKSQAKTFFYDNGVRNYLCKDFSPYDKRKDKGILHELFVLQEFEKTRISGIEFYFWRNRKKEEVDFILKRDQTILPVEVKSEMTSMKITPSMKAFAQNYPDSKRMIILNTSLFSEKEENGFHYFFRPLYYADQMIKEFFIQK